MPVPYKKYTSPRGVRQEARCGEPAGFPGRLAFQVRQQQTIAIFLGTHICFPSPISSAAT